MPILIATSRGGASLTLSVNGGASLMEALRAGGIDEIAAICGGGCSCATCHVYIDAAWLDKLPAAGADESDLLDSSSHRRPNSRLSCQIPFDARLDGLVLTIAPED